MFTWVKIGGGQYEVNPKNLSNNRKKTFDNIVKIDFIQSFRH